MRNHADSKRGALGSFARWTAAAACAAIAAIAVAACISVTGGRGEVTVHTYLLDPGPAPEGNGNGDGPVLLVSPIDAQVGLASRALAYTERPYELSHYAYNEWAESPPRMLEPLLVDTLDARHYFAAVVGISTGVLADLQLDTELIRLQHEFTTEPSQARVAMRAQLIHLRRRCIVAASRFEAVAPANADDPYGGVAAINRALREVLDDLADFAVEAASDGSRTCLRGSE